MMTEGAQRSDESGADEPAFDDLFRREFVPITRTAYLVVGDWEVAREIAQDAFVQALRHWKKVQGLESPGGWVRRVAIRDAVRSRRRDARGRTLGLEGGRGDTEPALALDVRAALLTLPTQQRAVIALYYLDDRPVAEIASLLGCSDGTVKTHLARGRHALAALLGEEVTDELR
jgi:DNA-directed RNA polymerase specialized sigma24 family protein